VVRANKAVWELWNKELDISDTRTLEQYLIDQGVSDEGRALIEAGYSNTLCSTSDRLPIYGMHCIELRLSIMSMFPLTMMMMMVVVVVAGVIRLERAWSGDGGGDYRMDDSMGVVINNMASQVNGGVRTSWAVTSIDYSQQGVVTLTNDRGETIQGSAVVSTVPVAILKRGSNTTTCIKHMIKVSKHATHK
jgi:monoamine oxidase